MARRLALVLVVALAFAGCLQPPKEAQGTPRDDLDDAPSSGEQACAQTATSSGAVGGGQSGVSNQPGSFTYGGQVAGKTGKEVHLWENPGEAASVMWGGQAGTGSLTLTIQDTCGKEVYQKELSGAAQQSGAVESSSAGEPGLWALTFEFTLYTGQMGLQISST